MNAERKPPYEFTLLLRQSHIGSTCKLHFDGEPLKITRGSKQYLYDDNDEEYLDCVSSVAHVGHCHPHVVQSGQAQMAKLTASFGWLTDIQSLYAKKLIETFPDKLSVCYFVNSGCEANDVALMLARAYTNKKDVIVLDQSDHGGIGNSAKLSVSRFKEKHLKKPKWVHVVPCPNQYRGPFPDDAEKSADYYASHTLDILQEAQSDGRQVAAFMFECIQLSAGVVMPPPGYLQFVCSRMKENGILCIADEIGSGMGRTGDDFWAFRSLNIVPDIVTIGKPMGNGQPIAAVITTKEIADSIGEFASTFGGNSLSCAIGVSVIDVIHNEKLISSAKFVGRSFIDGFNEILPKHPLMGDVRGRGLFIGVELVEDKASRKPYTDLAEFVQTHMRRRHILVGVVGRHKNIVSFTPPMCITCDNARKVVHMFDQILTDIESGQLMTTSKPEDESDLISLDVVLGHKRSHSPNDDSEAKRKCYEAPD